MRLPYAANPPSSSDANEQAFIDKLVKSRGKGGLTQLDRSMLHSPKFTRGFMQFFTTVRQRGILPQDVVELAMCRVAALNGAAFEWMHHAPLLKKAGVSDEGLENVRVMPPSLAAFRKGDEGGLNERLWRVLRYTDAMTRDVTVGDEVFEDVKTEFSEQEIVELTLTIAGYNAVSRYLVALDVAELKDTEVGKAKL